MIDLPQLQQIVFDLIRQPPGANGGMSERTDDGGSAKTVAQRLVRPSAALTSFERLEIYSRSYWARIRAAFTEDFPGLRAVVGERRFEKLAVAYLADCPSESFSLRDLGSRLEGWLREQPELLPKAPRLPLDMARLEWAQIEAYDGAERPKLRVEDLRNLGEDSTFDLQPHLQLLLLEYPVDDLLLRVQAEASSCAAAESAPVRRRLRLPRPGKICLAVHRFDEIVCLKRLHPAAFDLLQELRLGKSLSAALEASLSGDGFPQDKVAERLQDWFANWSSLGWFAIPGRR